MDENKGYIYVTSSGYDPERGDYVKDPYLGDTPSLGACMPHIRRQVERGDHLFVVSGKIPNLQQYVIGGFEVDEIIDSMEAYRRFPEQRLHRDEQGRVLGNIICDGQGNRHALDHHNPGDDEKFEARVQNYVIGKNALLVDGPLAIS